MVLGKIFLISIIVGICNATTCSNDETCNLCGDKIKILDPSLNMGKIQCTDHGEYSKGCVNIINIKPVCTLTPLENPTDEKCYHYYCKWQSKDGFKIEMKVNDEYDTIVIDLYPTSDMSPAATLIMILIVLSLWCCMISSGDPYYAGYAGGIAASSWGSSGGSGYGSSSGTC